MDVQKSVQVPVFNSFVYIARNGIFGSYGNSTFHFLNHHCTVFMLTALLFISIKSAQVFQFLHIITNPLYVLLIVSILLGMWWYFVWFSFAFLWWLVKWNIFSCACWPFLHLLWRNIFSRAFHCSFTQSYPNLCDPVNCSTSGFLFLHSLPEFAQTLVHWVDDAIHPSPLLLPPCPQALKLSQHQGIFQWVGSLHQVAKGLKPQHHHQSFQRIFKVDVL